MNRFLICLAVVSFQMDFVWGQTPYSVTHANQSIGEIERRLDQKRDMVFHDATLLDLCDFLNSTGIPTYLDERALEDYGIEPDARFHFQQNAIRLYDGLQLALRERDLTFTILNSRLVITTPEEAEARLMTRFYDVRHLVDLVAVPLRTHAAVRSQTTLVYQYDFDSLIDTITSTIAPESWDQVGGPGSIEPYFTRRMRVLVVSQTYDVQRDIVTLLRELAMLGGTAPLHTTPSLAVVPQRLGSVFRTPPQQVSPQRTRIHASRLRSTGQRTSRSHKR